MKHGKLLASGLMLSALAIGSWHQAMASSYFGEVCLVLETPVSDEASILVGTLRIGLDDMGDQHFTGSGTLDSQADEDLRPVSGNAELIGKEWLLSLLSTWPEGNDIFHMRMDKDSYEGEYSRIRTVLVDGELGSSYDTGTVRLNPECADIKPGSPCDDLHIPYGHLPPPDSCRIWNPALSAGQQRPPFACEAPYEDVDVPRGACLVDQYGLIVEVGTDEFN